MSEQLDEQQPEPEYVELQVYAPGFVEMTAAGGGHDAEGWAANAPGTPVFTSDGRTGYVREAWVNDDGGVTGKVEIDPSAEEAAQRHKEGVESSGAVAGGPVPDASELLEQG
jgi:hypothetical protein